MSRAAVAQALLNSSESQGDLVDGYYLAYLNRAAGTDERSFWVNLLQTRLNLEVVGESILASDEYFHNAAKLVS